MQAIGKLIDWVDKNHDKPEVKTGMIFVFVLCLTTAGLLLYSLPSHEEYCKTAVNNHTCGQYK